MSQQFISFKLKEISLTEDARWEFINLDLVRGITIKDTRIDFFQTFADQGITIKKEDHPTAYEAILHFLLNKLEGNYNIVEEDMDAVRG